MNVLGVIFDSKLKWADHVAKAFKKSNCTRNAKKIIQKFFTQKEHVCTHMLDLDKTCTE